MNMKLQEDNLKLYQESRYLNEQIHQLNEYIVRMEQDLASHNIKSPRILNELHDRTFNEIHQNSI